MQIFLHLPKTAGTTLNDIFRRVYGSNGVYISNCEATSIVSDFMRLTDDDRRTVEIVSGHIPYGIHRLLNCDCEYLTILRDPVARVVSAYNYAKNTPEHRDYDSIHRERMTLADFLRAPGGMENQMVRLISGDERANLSTANPECPPHLLDVAKENLSRNFRFVGIMEDFTRSLVLLKRRLGWSHTPLFMNKNVGAYTYPDLSDEEVELLQKITGLDSELYAFAKQLYGDALRAQDDTLEDEVADYSGYLQEYQHDIADTQKHLNDIMASRIWRYSRPFVATAIKLKSLARNA